jgi:hypothetical protein
MKSNIQLLRFNIQRRIIARFVFLGRWKLNARCSLFPLAILFLFPALPLHAQTNAPTTNTFSTLVPPYDELPPTFWEQNGSLIVVAMIVAVMLAALAVWLVFRPKLKIVVPPEVQARQALAVLRQQPEDGVVLSRVSQVLRHYFIAAFQLAPGEFTTAEFSGAISSHQQISAELSTATADFLCDCDARKFSTAGTSAPLNAAAQALDLIARAEQRRAQLSPLAETQTQSRRA